MTERVSQIVETLRQRGLKLTPQRQAVIEAITAREDHPTVEEIHTEVRARFPMTALTTVYDTLQRLVEAGAIGALWPHATVQRYDRNADPHAHLVCIHCRKVIDIPPLPPCPHPPAQAEDIKFQILHQVCEFHGLCADCQET
jgi:Fur family peroxide stress response transcriptional regulator